NGAPLGDFAINSPAVPMNNCNFMLFHTFARPRISSITRSNLNVIVRWPARADTRLQSNTNVVGANWQAVAGTLGASVVTNAVTAEQQFFRLERD
ncbi:MAG TPA: hypothetical protein VK530_03325, partial [Candidatus Acidoferrum sp.]|nr:hypothetical protein [Candidatus Acidoferrum sp.]